MRSTVKTASASSGPLPLAQRVAGSPSMAFSGGNRPSESSWDIEAVIVPSWARSGSAAAALLTGSTAANEAATAVATEAASVRRERVSDMGIFLRQACHPM